MTPLFLLALLAAPTVHQLPIACQGIPVRDVFITEHNQPEEPRGTVILVAGGDGRSSYCDDPVRCETLQTLVTAGYHVIDVRYGGSRGWATYPGYGFRATMCVYNEAVRWIHANLAINPETVCVQGNSGGAMQIAVGLTHYGLDEIIDFAIPSAGPPVARSDLLCRDLVGFKPTTAAMVDRMMDWPQDTCGYEELDTAQIAALEADSIAFEQGQVLDTYVYIVISDRDKTREQAEVFDQAIDSNLEFAVVPGNAHGVDKTWDGHKTILELMLKACRP